MGDSARAETTLPLPAAEVAEFVRDVERLWRLNPHLDIREWQPRDETASPMPRMTNAAAATARTAVRVSGEQ